MIEGETHYGDPLPEPRRPGYHWARTRLGGHYVMVRVEDNLTTLWVETWQHQNPNLRALGQYSAMMSCPVEQYYDFIPLPVPS